MRIAKLTLVLLLCLLPVRLLAQDGEMSLGLYVVVSDLERSKSFYTELFGAPAYFENEGFAGFSVSGSLFGLFRETDFTHELRRGNNSVPYIQVNDILKEFTRVKAMGADLVHDEIVSEGPIQLFMFKDPDGNSIEFFTLSNGGPQ